MPETVMTGEYVEKLLTEKLDGLRAEIGQYERQRSDHQKEVAKYASEIQKLEQELAGLTERVNNLKEQEKSMTASCALIEKEQAASHQKRKEELASISASQEKKASTLTDQENEIKRKSHNLDAQKLALKTTLEDHRAAIVSAIDATHKKLDAIHPDK